MSDADRDRIRNLMAEGKLAEREAEGILDALEVIERRRTAAARPEVARRPGRYELLHARYLSGAIDAPAFRKGVRSVAFKMGVLFGLAMFATFALALLPVMGRVDADIDPAVAAAVGLPLGVVAWALGGAFFGGFMYLVVLAPRARRLVRLKESLASPLDPMVGVRAGQCPTCGAENAKNTTRKSWMMRHWAWNPGLAVNDLVFGQRIPAEYADCRECGASFTDCAACDRAIDLMVWPEKRFGNWGDLHCPHCHAVVPCNRNRLGAWLGRLLASGKQARGDAGA